MDNVESAEAAGDHFPTTRVLTADGVVSLIGCLMGNPFINAVYIGHPGWKAMGGRQGYSAATGILMLLLTWFGVVALMMAVIPAVALLPILLYIGMLIRSEEHTSELQSLMRISSAVFCLQKKQNYNRLHIHTLKQTVNISSI